MPIARVQMPDGRIGRFEVPEGTTPEQVIQSAQGMQAASGPKAEPAEQPSMASEVSQGIGNLAAGAMRGAGSIGSTILAPYDMAKDALAGKGLSWESNRQRRRDIDEGLKEAHGADPKSLLYQGGKLVAEIAGTAGVGGVLAKGVTAVSKSPRTLALANSLSSFGMKTGQKLPRAADMGMRVLGGATTGGAATALVNPDDAATGAAIGGALPVALKGVGKLAGKAGQALRGGVVSDEVLALAARAKELGIHIPADRLTNSRPLNAVASSLNYIPFSGRAASETAMVNQLTTATSRLIGQDTNNMTKALRAASFNLGAKFENTLKNNVVKVDDVFLDELATVESAASNEGLGEGLKAITTQIDQLLKEGATGAINGKAAYNIKRTLDRIGKRKTPEAFHARELKNALIGALDRSLGPKEAAAFAKTREQYGNMLTLEKIAQNGADGDISIASLANMRNIKNKPLQEIADIAAQFVKPRESQHGAMQRAAVALGVGTTTGPAGLGATMAAGKATNMALNSEVMRRYVARQPGAVSRLGQIAQSTLPRTLPLLASDR